MKRRLDGKKMLVRLSRVMEADIRDYCRAKGIDSEAELVRQSVAKYIYADYEDGTLKLQGLQSLRESAAELKDMLELVIKYLFKMHTNLLAYHAEIDDGLKDAAYRSAVTRHEKFFASFQSSLKNDPSFFEKLLHKYFSEADDGQA